MPSIPFHAVMIFAAVQSIMSPDDVRRNSPIVVANAGDLCVESCISEGLKACQCYSRCHCGPPFMTPVIKAECLAYCTNVAVKPGARQDCDSMCNAGMYPPGFSMPQISTVASNE